MKKLTTICALATSLIGGGYVMADDWYFPSDKSSYEDRIQDVNRNYHFTADAQTFIHNRTDGGARHITGSIYFYIDGDYSATIDSKHYTPSFQQSGSSAGSQTFGWNGAHIVGSENSSMTLTVQDSASPVWISTNGIRVEGGTTLYLNYGEKISYMYSDSSIYLSDGSTVYQNTRGNIDGKLFVFHGASATTTNKVGGTVVFTQESLTQDTSKGAAIVNTAINSDVTVKFDESFVAGSTVNFLTEVNRDASYRNNFDLSGQNVNIYAKSTTLDLNVNNSDKLNKSTVYVEADNIYLGKLEADENSAIHIKGKITGGNFYTKTKGEKIIEMTADSTLTNNTETIKGALITLKSADDTRRTLTVSSRINVESGFDMQNSKLLIKNGFSSGATQGNNAMQLKMDSKSELETYGGLRISANSEIGGKIIVSGTGRNVNGGGDDFKLAFSNGVSTTITLKSTAHIIQKFDSSVTVATSQAKNWIANGTILIENGAKLQLEDRINVSNTKIILNGANSLNIGMNGAEFNSQAQSTINLETPNKTSPASLTTTEFVFNAANELGSFAFSQNNMLLAISFGENGSLVLGEDSTIDSFTGEFFNDASVLVKGEVLNQLRIFDIENTDAFKNKFIAENGYDIYFVDNGDGSFFVNTVVPEPAEWAMIFGAIALGFVAYRKRS